jgi:hypothetical protein
LSTTFAGAIRQSPAFFAPDHADAGNLLPYNDDMNARDPIPLGPGEMKLELRPDRRERVPEPLPVKLISIDDVHLPAPAGAEHLLDQLYVGILQMIKVSADHERLVYRADNFDLVFELAERPVPHDSLVATQIEIPSLRAAMEHLTAAEIEFDRARGLVPGDDRLVFLDPAGNWINLQERRMIL